MKTEELKALGLSDEQAAGVFALHGKEVNAGKAAAEELKTTKAALAERDAQLEQLRGAGGDAEALKQQIAQLQADNKAKDNAHAAELLRLRTDAAVERALTAAGAKNLVMAKALLADFLAKAETDDAGAVKGLEDKIKELVGGSDTGFLFDSAADDGQITLQGALPANTPGKPPAAERGKLESRYAAAKKAGNLTAAIQVKREAAEAGIYFP